MKTPCVGGANKTLHLLVAGTFQSLNEYAKMATPAAPAVGLTVLYHPGSSESSDARQWPAVVLNVLDSAGNETVDLAVLRQDAASVLRQRIMSAASWTTAGSNPATPHWGYAVLNPS